MQFDFLRRGTMPAKFLAGACFGIFLLALSTPRTLAQEDPQPTAAANGENAGNSQGIQLPPAVAAIRESNPTTADELIEAINQLVAFRAFDMAHEYAIALGALEMDSATMVEVGERIGPIPLLRIVNDSRLDQKGRDQCRKILAAVHAERTDPERLAALAETAVTDKKNSRLHAIADLRSAGPLSVGPLVTILADPERRNQHRPAIDTIAQVGLPAVPPLLAVMESKNDELRANVLQILGRLEATSALHDMLAASIDSNVPLQKAAKTGIMAVTGNLPATVKIKEQLRDGIKDRLVGRYSVRTDLDDRGVLWQWDDGTRSLTSRKAEKPLLLAQAAYRIAQALSRIDSDNEESLRIESIARLQRDKLIVGLDSPIESQTVGALQELGRRAAELPEPASITFVDFVEAVFEEALRKGYLPAAIAAAEVLAGEAGKDKPGAHLIARRAPAQHPLVDAATHSDRRLRFAATRALIKLDPDLPFVGASAVTEALRFFASLEGEPHILLADSRPNRRQRIAGLLKASGYMTDPYNTGSKAFAAATKSAEYVAAFLSFTIGPRPIQDILHEMRSDPRTAGLPIGLIVDVKDLQRADGFAENDPLTLVFLPPRDVKIASQQIDRLIAVAGANFVSQEVRLQQAAEAIRLIDDISKTPNELYDLTAFDSLLAKSLQNDALSLLASRALGNIGSPFAQAALVDAASMSHLPVTQRRAAAKAFIRSVNKRGIGLTLAQIQRQANRYKESAERGPEDEAILWSILEVIQNAKHSR